MLYKFLKFNTKKIISILCAIAVLATALPLSALLMPTKAATTGDYIDFEGKDAANIVDGNDNFSLLGVDKEDKYYFYGKNNTDKTLSITFDGIELEANKNYTLNLDVYTLRTSKDDDNSLLGLKVYGENEVSLEKSVSNLDICEEAWANYHTTFTVKENSNKLDFSLFTFGKVFIDNFAIIDENGKEIALDFAKACENTEHPDHFSSATLYDIAYDEIDVIDGYLKAAVPENSNTIHNEGVDIPFNLPEKIEEGRYTLKVDLKFTALGTCRDSFCASIAGSGAQIQQKWINAVDIELNKYATYTFEFDLLPAHNYFRFNVYQGCTAYIDNVILIDATGSEIININFDEPVNFSGNYFEQKGIPKTKAQSRALYQRLMTLSSEDNYVVAIDNSKGTNFGQLYLHEVGMPYDTTYPAGDYTIKFDFYALEIGSSKNIVAQLTKPDWSGDAFPGNGQKWLEIQEKLNEWQTLSFDITTVAEGRFPWFYIGAGMKGYFDNYQIIDKKTGNTVLNFTPTEADLGKTSKEICKVEKLAGKTDDEPVVDNYVVAIDNSKGTNFGQLYLHEVGMPYDTTYPAGDYTIKFDFYALEIGSSKNIVAQLTKPDWSGDAFPGNGQKWLEIQEKLNEWQTLSFDITTVAEGRFPWFYIGAGMKGYFDNYQIIDKKTGETVLNFTPTEADLGKTSKEICKVEKIAGATEEEPAADNYVVAIDNSKGTNFGQLYLHEVGMDYSKTYPVGDYTFKFDFYALEIGSNKNIVAQLTKPDWSGDAFPGNGQKWLEIEEKLNEWQTLSFDITTVAEGRFPWFYIGAGIKGYFDNYQIIDKKTGETVLNFTPTAADLGKTSKEICKVEKLAGKTDDEPAVKETVLLVDTTSVTDNGSDNKSFWFNELGMPSYYNKLVSGKTYTVIFDVYPIEVPTANNTFHFRTANGQPNGSSHAGFWGKNADFEVGKWQTTSNTFKIDNAAASGNHILYVYGGFKGYIDNFRIIDENGDTVEGTFTGFDGLTVPDKHKDYLTITEIVTGDDEPAKKETVLLIDTTSVDDNGTANKSFWFNELGMPSYSSLANGTYTIQFDVCALEMPTSKNLFHYRTGNGRGPSSDAGFWKPDLTIGEWTTTSSTFTVTDATTSGNHILFVYGGFKGYVDNLVILDSNGNEVAGTRTDITGLTVPDKHKDYLTITEIVIGGEEPAQKETVLLVDTTSVDDNGTANKSFWFNELGMPSYSSLANGTYTIQFDVCALQMPTSKNLFHYRTGNGRGASSDAGFWKPDLTIGEWTTTSSTFTVTDATTSGNHILFVYGGFKGYVDNLVILDSNGNEVAGTRTDMTDLTVPDKHKDYLTITEIVIGGEEPAKKETVLLVDTTSVDDNGTANKSFWFNELGMPSYSSLANGTYTIQFDVCALQMPTSKNLFHYRTGNGRGASSDAGFWKPDLTIGEWTTTSSTFTVTDATTSGNHILFVYGGFKGYIDNMVILDSNGNEVAGTRTDMTDLTVPDKHKDYLTITEIVIGGEEPDEPVEPEKTSGMKITVLRGMAGKDGATIKLGGANSPLTIKSNSTYRLSFRYYQANPTNTGTLNLFGINAGFDNDIAYFKKNNTTGWANGTVYFTTGEVSDASADWLEIILNPNAWVYFDDFKIVEQAVDNNKEVSVITFDNADDSIYPSATVEKAEFGQSTEKGGTFKVVNATEYTNDTKNSNRQYTFKGIKMNSNTTYKVSLDYYVAAPFNDYAAAFGYDQTGLGTGSGNSWPCFIDNEASTGWHTVSFIVTTGDVVPNGNYINLAFYDVADSSEPRVMHFDNLTLTKLYKIETSTNDGSLGSMTKTFSTEAGKDAKVVANAYAGAKFEGWYEYGDLVSTDKIYRIKNVNDNHKLVAKFSGEVKPDKTIVQSFEDYDIGDIGMEYYEIVNDSKNVLDGKQSLHVKPDKIGNNIEASIFFPVVANAEQQMKDDYIYDVYVWVKPTKEAESVAYYALLTSDYYDQSDMIPSGGGYASIGVSNNIKPHKASALEVTEDGWHKYMIGSVTKDLATKSGFCFQICKFHDKRQEGASIDDLYIDRVELVERTPDFENLKFTEVFYNEITNSNFEEKVTEDNWGPLTDGLTVEKVTDKQYDWQGNYQLVFDAEKSNGQEYVRAIPIAKQKKNYTFAAWTKLSEGSDISVGFYKNGKYQKFENIVNGEKGTLKLIDDGKWNRVSFTFNVGDCTEGYLVIKGTKGILELDMVELFVAEKGYLTDPNISAKPPKFEMFDPIAFPDKVITDVTYIENDVEEPEEEEIVEEEQEEEKKPSKKKKYKVLVKKPGGISPWVWVGVGAGVLVIAAGVVFLILFKKRNKTKKEAE